MAALSADNVTVTAPRRLQNLFGGGSNRKAAKVSLTFGDGALTYPTGGVPVPPISKLGFKKGIDFGAVSEAHGTYIVKYNETTHKLMLFSVNTTTGALQEILTSAAPAAMSVSLLLVGA